MKVNVIIGGGQKCGTTALHHYLSKHPQVVASSKKELDFFAYPEVYNLGIAYYHSFFKNSIFKRIFERKQFFLEASPSYLFDGDPILTAKRIYDYNPNCKIIFSVRNPIDRAYSAFEMYKKQYFSSNKEGWINWVMERNPELVEKIVRRTEKDFKSFEVFITNELLAIQNNQLIEYNVLNLGHYFKGIEAFNQFFQPLIVSQEQMDNNLNETLTKVAKYIGLKEYDWNQLSTQKVFKGEYQKDISTLSRSLLSDYYEDSNTNLFHLTGIDYKEQQ